MKLIHTSDWHFGMPLGTGSYAEDQRYFLEQLYRVIRETQAEALLLAGDVYDSGLVGAEAIGLYNEAVTTLCAGLKIPVIVIAGNHDSAPRLASCRELLKASGLHVTGRLEKDPEPVLLDGGKVAVYPLPFFGREEVAALYPGEKDRCKTQEGATLVLCDHIREGMDPKRFNIILSHAMVVGAELSESDRSARVGFATAVSAQVFHGFDYVALGHIHKPQVISPTVRYSGSPLKYSFGNEERQEKGVVLLDTDTGEQTFLPIPALRGRATVTGTLAELLAREDLEDSYLRLHVTDRYAGLELIAQLREHFPQLLEVYGRGLTESDSICALSLDELHRMDEMDIMEKFMAESFHSQPSASQRELFRQVLQWSREEDNG